MSIARPWRAGLAAALLCATGACKTTEAIGAGPALDEARPRIEARSHDRTVQAVVDVDSLGTVVERRIPVRDIRFHEDSVSWRSLHSGRAEAVPESDVVRLRLDMGGRTGRGALIGGVAGGVLAAFWFFTFEDEFGGPGNAITQGCSPEG